MDVLCTLICISCVFLVVAYMLLRPRFNAFQQHVPASLHNVRRFYYDTSRRLSNLSCSHFSSDLRRRSIQTCGDITTSLVSRFSQLRKTGSTFEVKCPIAVEEHQNVDESVNRDICVDEPSSERIVYHSEKQTLTVDSKRYDGATEAHILNAEEETRSKTLTSDDVNFLLVEEQDTGLAPHMPSLNEAIEEEPEPKSTVDDDGMLKPIALRKAKIANNFGLSESNRIDTDEMMPNDEPLGGDMKPTTHVSMIPTITLNTCTEDEPREIHSRSVSFVSNDEHIVPVTTYSTVSPRRMSLKPGVTPFHQVTPKRGSIMLPASTVSPAVRRKSIIVQPQGYVCPRRTSVLFSSDIFAHSPRRKSSICGRSLHVPDVIAHSSRRKSSVCVRSLHVPDVTPAQSKRFFLPRKSVIKNVIRSSWTGVKTPANGEGNLRTGVRASTSCTGSYYPHRRRSSVGFSDTTANNGNVGNSRTLPSLNEIGKSFSRRKSMFKKILKAPFQSADTAPAARNGVPRRESRAGLFSFRKQSLFGRRQSTHIPKQKGNYLTGNLTEFKSVFGPKAHDVLTEKFRSHGPLYEITALGQKTVFLFDHKDIEYVKKAEGRYPKHMDFKHLRLYRQRNDLPLGMLLSNGEEWRQQRRILSKALMSTVSTAQYVPVLDKVQYIFNNFDSESTVSTAQYVPVLDKVAKSSIEIISKALSRDEVYLPEEDVGNYVIEAFGRVLYGRELHCLEKGATTELHQFVKTAKSNFGDAKQLMILPTCLMLLHPAWRRHNDRWNSLLETTVHQVRQSMEPGQKRHSSCVLSQLFTSGEMTEPEILVNLTDLLLASIDTTANVILWCLYELGRQPLMQDRIVEDFIHAGCLNNIIKFQNLRDMSFLKAVVKETLRLHPVGFLTCRTVSKSMNVRHYNIPPKTNVAAAMYVMGRNSDLTYDQESFIPERWLANDPVLESFYNTVPFGFGTRGCIGRKVAEFEIALFILHFCRSFRFKLKDQEVIEHNTKLLLVPAKSLELILEKRH